MKSRFYLLENLRIPLESNVLSDYEGGAITYEMNGVYHIRGIVSVTQAISTYHPLRKSLVYVVFTDVTKYLHWIAEKVPSLPSPPKGNNYLFVLRYLFGKSFCLSRGYNKVI